METNNFSQWDSKGNSYQNPVDIQNVSTEVMSKTFMSKVFTWMFAGLSVTGLLAYYFGTIPHLQAMLSTTTNVVDSDNLSHVQTSPSGLGYFLMFAPFGLILLISFAVNRLSYIAMVFCFLLFSAMLGISLSSIFLVYTSASIFSIFLITAGMFGAMALLGYTTSTDLTKMGSLMMMLLFGVIIAQVVNMFLHSPAFNYMLSFICVAIFTGLTAYDVQKIKRIGAQMSGDNSVVGKASIFGALSLYLDFINLFIALLSIFGNRKE